MGQLIVLARYQVRELFARTRCRADFRYGRMLRCKIMEKTNFFLSNNRLNYALVTNEIFTYKLR